MLSFSIWRQIPSLKTSISLVPWSPNEGFQRAACHTLPTPQSIGQMLPLDLVNCTRRIRSWRETIVCQCLQLALHLRGARFSAIVDYKVGYTSSAWDLLLNSCAAFTKSDPQPAVLSQKCISCQIPKGELKKSMFSDRNCRWHCKLHVASLNCSVQDPGFKSILTCGSGSLLILPTNRSSLWHPRMRKK